jgi:hypothetical protein
MSVEFLRKLSDIICEAESEQLLAPNGNPSKLTPKQWNQVRTPQFKAWFGDWENNPSTASKVVDENGEPMVMYHGGNGGITVFNKQLAGTVNKSDWGQGVYFTPSQWSAENYMHDANKKNDARSNELWDEMESTAKEYGTDVMSMSIDLRNGKITQDQYNELSRLDNEWIQARRNAEKTGTGAIYAAFLNIRNPEYYTPGGITDPYLADYAHNKGKDGIIIEYRDGGFDEIVVFHPNQIKSAIKNSGKFSSSNSNIYEEVKLLPSNGRPSKQEYTPQFKAWFGDSKVVDSNKNPLRVYHGTTKDFDTFVAGMGKAHPMLATDDNKLGFFFTPEPGSKSDSGPWSGAARYAGMVQKDGTPVGKHGSNIIPVYLKIESPYKVEMSEYFKSAGNWTQEGIEVLGFDGIIVTRNKQPLMYVAFHPTQIKSAIGNTGKYSLKHPSITENDEYTAKVNIPIPTFYEDIPNENWLQGKIRYAVEKPRSKYGVPEMSSITGYFSSYVYIPIRWLNAIKGQNGEQSNVRVDALNGIRQVIQQTGKFPLTDSGKEYAPYIEIGYDGIPWISEGNHRIMAAAAEGLEYIPIELRYFDGGQRNVDRKWSPNNILEITKRILSEKS